VWSKAFPRSAVLLEVWLFAYRSDDIGGLDSTNFSAFGLAAIENPRDESKCSESKRHRTLSASPTKSSSQQATERRRATRIAAHVSKCRKLSIDCREAASYTVALEVSRLAASNTAQARKQYLHQCAQSVPFDVPLRPQNGNEKLTVRHGDKSIGQILGRRNHSAT